MMSEPLLYGSTAESGGGGYQSGGGQGESPVSPSAPASSSAATAASHPQAQPYESMAAADHKMAMGGGGGNRGGGGSGGQAVGAASAGFESAMSVPADAQLFSCEVLNGQGGAHAKSWLWLSRDQICIGSAQYPVLSICARIRHFLWLLFCCGCFRTPSNVGWRDGQPWRDDDEEDEEDGNGEKVDTHANLAGAGAGLPPRLRREASLLVFSSRVDYISVSAFKAVKERLRYSLPTVWTQWFSPIELGGWVWQLVKSLTNWVFGMELGWVLVSIGLCIGCICHGAHAAGLYGNPDSFKHGVHWMVALWFFTIAALVFHFEWKIVWSNEAPASRAGRKQLGRWSVVTLLWCLAFLFLSLALVAGLVFLRKEYNLYPNEGPVNDWSKHQNLMCTSWDDRLGVIKPFEPVPQPPQPVTPSGPPPSALQIVSVVTGSSNFPAEYFVDVMFLTPVSYDPVNMPITGWNGTAYGSDGSVLRTTATLPLGGQTSGLPVVGLQFQPLSLTVNYTFSVGTSNSQGNSAPAFVNGGHPMYPQEQCAAPVTSCVVPPAPRISSLRAGSPGDGFAYVSASASSPIGAGVVIPEVLFFTISGPQGFVSVTAQAGQEIAVPNLPAHQWLSFTATATNVIGVSDSVSDPSYVWLEPSPTGVENMCSKQQRATLITFLFCASCALLLLIVLTYLTYVRRARRRFAIVTIHGQRQWGLPARVLLDLADARALEACFNRTLGKGQYELATAGYNAQQRLQNKRD